VRCASALVRQVVRRTTEEIPVAKKKTTTGPGAKTKRTRPAAKRTRPVAKRDDSAKSRALNKSQKAKGTARKGVGDPGQNPGWAGTAAAYASLGLAKGLRVAASTIGMVRGGKQRP
jgi:hypothetical protein